MNNRISTTQIVLIVLLVLVLTGAISLGAVLKVFLYIILGVVVLAIIGGWLLRRRFRRMAQQGQQYEQQSTKREGEVTIKKRTIREKEVSPSVGEYVEFEEIDD